jgi:CHASE3 domain sensor protein
MEDKKIETKITQLTKITLPVAIVIGAIVLAISFYAVQVNKSNSIEEQHKEELRFGKSALLLIQTQKRER